MKRPLDDLILSLPRTGEQSGGGRLKNWLRNRGKESGERITWKEKLVEPALLVDIKNMDPKQRRLQRKNNIWYYRNWCL